MSSHPTPHVAVGVTSEELTLKFGAAGRFVHEVTVPAGTRVRKLDGGSNPWVVWDLSFIEDKRSFLYFDADHYGIRVPEDKIIDVQEMPRPRPRF